MKGQNGEDDFTPLTKAIELAARAHDGQVHNGQPYIVHPLAVLVGALDEGYDDNQCCAAVLHDVVEDNDDISLDDLREMGFNTDVVYMVELLSRPPESCMFRDCEYPYDYRMHGQDDDQVGHGFVPGGPEMPYDEFIERVSRHPRAARIKLLDIEHNMGSLEGVADTAKRIRMYTKYTKARAFLLNALIPHGGRR